MILVQNYYKDKNPLRHLEIEKCLKENVNNHHIRKVLLLIDTDVVPDTVSKKIELRRVENRPTYTELFAAANEAALPNEVAIISNSDIYFDNTLGLAENIPADECYALSRWDMVRGELKPFHHSDSQDVWIMRVPIKDVQVGFPLGRPGSDNGIAYYLDKSGYSVTNPCKTILAIHLHEGGEHNYTAKDRVPPPYLRVIPQ